MRETFPVKLLLQLLQATPEELLAIERFLGGHAFADRQPSMRPAALLAPQRPDRGRYALKKGQGAWALTYDGAQAAFVDRAGMDFVHYLLKHPDEPIHSLELLAMIKGEAPVQQRSAVLDDKDATKDYLRMMARLRKLIESDDASDQEKEVAEEELAQLEAALPDIHHRTIDEAFKIAKSVRQAIRRVCLSLAKAQDEQHRPHPLLTAFAAHLRKHLLGPSQLGPIPAGHVVYEPPTGVAWA
jgi:hypothetical protein